MASASSGYIIGYHGCDKELGLKLLNGNAELKPSDNTWDWLGKGIYFWEHDPLRALQYSIETLKFKEHRYGTLGTPFVVGAVIDLGKCLNLVEVDALKILAESYDGLRKLMDINKITMPQNHNKNRALDCAVLNYVHQANFQNGVLEYDSVRCAFPEGEPAFPGSFIS